MRASERRPATPAARSSDATVTFFQLRPGCRRNAALPVAERDFCFCTKRVFREQNSFGGCGLDWHYPQSGMELRRMRPSAGGDFCQQNSPPVCKTPQRRRDGRLITGDPRPTKPAAFVLRQRLAQFLRKSSRRNPQIGRVLPANGRLTAPRRGMTRATVWFAQQWIPCTRFALLDIASSGAWRQRRSSLADCEHHALVAGQRGRAGVGPFADDVDRLPPGGILGDLHRGVGLLGGGNRDLAVVRIRRGVLPPRDRQRVAVGVGCAAGAGGFSRPRCSIETRRNGRTIRRR